MNGFSLTGHRYALRMLEHCAVLGEEVPQSLVIRKPNKLRLLNHIIMLCQILFCNQSFLPQKGMYNHQINIPLWRLPPQMWLSHLGKPLRSPFKSKHSKNYALNSKSLLLSVPKPMFIKDINEEQSLLPRARCFFFPKACPDVNNLFYQALLWSYPMTQRSHRRDSCCLLQGHHYHFHSRTMLLQCQLATAFLQFGG